MGTIIPTIFGVQRPQLGKKGATFRRLKRWLSGNPGRGEEKTKGIWSEWQDLNLRPLRPERSEYLLRH